MVFTLSFKHVLMQFEVFSRGHVTAHFLRLYMQYKRHKSFGYLIFFTIILNTKIFPGICYSSSCIIISEYCLKQQQIYCKLLFFPINSSFMVFFLEFFFFLSVQYHVWVNIYASLCSQTHQHHLGT